MESQVEAWRKRLEEDFPRGVLAIDYDPDEEHGDEESGPPPTAMSYQAPAVLVHEMATPFSPTIQLIDYRGMTSRDVIGAIDTYAVEKAAAPKQVLVTFTNGRTMRWSADVPEGLAARMKETR